MSPEIVAEPLLPPRPEQRKYKACGSAKEMWHSREPIVVLAGGAGGGKTRANLEKLNYCMLRWPGARGLILRKTRSSLTQTGLVTFEEKVLPVDSPICKGARRESRSSYHYPPRDGKVSEVVCGGMQQSGGELEKVMSSEYDVVVMIEMTEFDEEDLQRITTRMRNFACQRPDGTFLELILGDTNPSGPNHWIKRWEASKRLKLLESRLEDNPVYFDQIKKIWTPQGKVYVATLDNLTGVMYDRLRLGKWVQAEGVVYPEFDRKIHLIDRFEIPSDWRRVRVIDFGYANPFVVQWFAVDPDGRMYLYREIYRTQRTVRAHSEQIKALSEGETYEDTFADHDAEDRATLRECEVETRNANKNKSRGFQAVRNRLKLQGDGKPGLFILRDSLVERDDRLWDAKKPVCTLDEFDCYVWPKSSDGKAIKEEPVKEHDHGMDCLRYACLGIDKDYGAIEAPPDPEIARKEEQDERDRLQAEWLSPWNDELFGVAY